MSVFVKGIRRPRGDEVEVEYTPGSGVEVMKSFLQVGFNSPITLAGGGNMVWNPGGIYVAGSDISLDEEDPGVIHIANEGIYTIHVADAFDATDVAQVTTGLTGDTVAEPPPSVMGGIGSAIYSLAAGLVSFPQTIPGQWWPAGYSFRWTGSKMGGAGDVTWTAYMAVSRIL